MSTPGPSNQVSRRRKPGRADPAVEEAPALPVETAAAPALDASSEEPTSDAPEDEASAAPASAPPEDDARRLRDQLEALKRREAELRRRLAMSEHPDLADALRAVEAGALVVARVEAKLAEGLSKSEERRKATIEKRLASARARRAELDAQVAELELELAPLLQERKDAFVSERGEALKALATLVREHEASLHAKGLDLTSLLPELATWRAELDAPSA